jgi:hypothetical protein
MLPFDASNLTRKDHVVFRKLGCYDKKVSGVHFKASNGVKCKALKNWPNINKPQGYSKTKFKLARNPPMASSAEIFQIIQSTTFQNHFNKESFSL